MSTITGAGARTPEELEALHEDALVMRDIAMLRGVYDEQAVLAAASGKTASGVNDCVELALASWQGDHPYVADPCSLTLAGDLTLIVSRDRISVARRDRHGGWRYAIVGECGNASERGATP